MMALHSLRPSRLNALNALAFVAVLASAPAQATDSGAASAAIAKLLSTPTTSASDAAAKPDSPASGSEHLMVTPQAGETLDRLMRRVMPSHPFKEEFVRKAFFKLNPKLANTSPYRALPASLSLAVPSGQDLRQQMLEQHPAIGKALFDMHAPAANAEEVPAAGALKRRWVHFP